MIGSGSGTGPLHYESRDPVPTPKHFLLNTFLANYHSILKKKKKNNKKKQKKKQTEKHGSLVVSAHTGLRC